MPSTTSSTIFLHLPFIQYIADSNMSSNMDSSMDSSTDSNMTLPENAISFPKLQDSLQTFTTEFSKIQHIPAFDQGAAILVKLEQIQTTQNQFQNQFQTALNQFHTTLSQVQTTQSQVQTTQNQFQQETASNFTRLETRIQTLYIS
jgi:hypothetical protein